MNKQLSRFGLAIAVTTAVAAAPSPAQAEFVTYCSGVGGAVTVPGDLVVRAGDQCMLEGTVVEGNVRLGKDADLVVAGGDLKGSVTVRQDSFFDAESTTVAKRISATSAYGTYLRGSSVGGSYVGKAGEEKLPEGADEPFVYLESGSKVKNVTAATGELVLDESKATGSVSSQNGTYVDVKNAIVGKQLRAEGARGSVVVCDSEVYGSATVNGNPGGVQLGGKGSLDDCEGSNFFGQDVTVSGNTGGVSVVGNIIPGWLHGEGNDPAPTGDSNRVRGGVSGQFVDLQPAPEAEEQSVRAAGAEDSETKAAAADRRAAAVKAARAEGPGL